MNIAQFLNTIYLGDRYCKSVVIEGEAGCLKIQADVISRVRGDRWNYYADEDITDGFIVLTEVSDLEFTPSGLTPNDGFANFYAHRHSDFDDRYIVVFEVISVVDFPRTDQPPKVEGMEIRLTAGGIFLEDPRLPGVRITQ